MLKTCKQSFFLFVVLALSVSAKADDTVSFQSYILQLLEKQVMTDADLLQLEVALEDDGVVNPIECAHICTSSTRQIHHKAFKTLLDKDLDVSLLKDWLRKVLIKRGHQREEREQVEEDTHQLYRDAPAKISVLSSDMACAIDQHKKVRCWGVFKPDKGWLEVYEAEASCEPAQSRVPPDLPDAWEIGVGRQHACILSYEGTVHCWGWGDANTYRHQIAVPPSLLKVKKIVVGYQHTCVIQENNAGVCWGDGTFENLLSSSTEVAHIGITVSDGTTCIFDSDKHVINCEGAASIQRPSGELPIDVNFQVLQMTIGHYIICALVKDGFTRVPCCWEMPKRGGMGSRYILENIPKFLTEPVQISLGHAVACILEAEGKVLCWGQAFIAPKGLEKIFQITSSILYDCFCGIDVYGRPHCWGASSWSKSIAVESSVPEDLIVDTSWWTSKQKQRN